MSAKLVRVVPLALICFLLAGSLPLAAQEQKTVEVKSAEKYVKGRRPLPNIFAPYAPMKIEHPQLTNSPKVDQLVQGQQMVLSLDDAISLALENNLDISVQRFVPYIADTDILRAMSGGATRGLAGTGTASVLGALPGTSFDPVFSIDTTWDRRSVPINNPFLAGTGTSLNAITNQTTQGNFRYQQGFHTGTGIAIGWNNSRQSTTSPGAFLNPSVTSSFTFSFQQQLLSGFGLLPNTRFIISAKNGKRIADLAFSEQVITTVSNVQNLYWDLVFAREDVKVKQRSVELAQKLYNDNKRQVEIGTLAPIEVVRAEAEVARTRQDLIVAQTFLLQQQTLLKNAITKNPMHAGLIDVEIIPSDVIVKPPVFEVPTIQEAVQQAWGNRPEIKRSEIDLENREINVKATRNALLPTLTLFGQYGSQGLAGNSAVLSSPVVVAGDQIVDTNGVPVAGLFVPATTVTQTGTNRSGFSQANGTVFDFDFPNYSVGLSLTIPILNRSGQADSARAQLEQRQAETSLRRLQNNIVVEVRNALIALEQNRARVEAAQKARELAVRTLDAEQKKYQLGASTIFFVIQAQRDLAQAESTEVRALADLLKAKVEYDRSLGRTLQTNSINIEIAEAGGRSKKNGELPGNIIGTLSNTRAGKY